MCSVVLILKLTCVKMQFCDILIMKPAKRYLHVALHVQTHNYLAPFMFQTFFVVLYLVLNKIIR